MNVSHANTAKMTETGIRFDSIVVGLGKTGQSVLDYLLGLGQTVAAVDSRLQPPGIVELRQRYPQLEIHLGEFDPVVLASARQLVVSPGVSIHQAAIKTAMAKGVELNSDVEIFCRQVHSPIIAVTGSNGKSTVVSLLTMMIEKSGHQVKLAGNIGTPVLELLQQPAPDFYVLELSSFQLETLSSLDALASVVLNISPDHMDRYDDLGAYVRSKQKIYRGKGCMILNLDDPAVKAMAEPQRKSIHYSLHEPQGDDFGVGQQLGELYLMQGEKYLIPAASLRMHGEHNISNALACLALGQAIGLPLSPMLASLQEFGGLPHRCEWVDNINGVDWYNDSKGTNVGASVAAIEGLSAQGRIILIAGGEGKNADFRPLADAIKKHVSAVILIGKDAAAIDKALAQETGRYFATSMDAAVSTAAQIAARGDLVLLSPACASQDMYQDYQERGSVFTRAVLALAESDQ